MSEGYTFIVKVRKLEEGEQVRCLYNSEICSKEYQVHIIFEEENHTFEVYICGIHYAINNILYYTEALSELSKKNYLS